MEQLPGPGAPRQGPRHVLAEFTPEDLDSMVGQGPGLRGERLAP